MHSQSCISLLLMVIVIVYKGICVPFNNRLHKNYYSYIQFAKDVLINCFP